MAELRRVYFDTTIFVDMVKTDLGKKLEDGRESGVWIAKKLLEAHRDKEIKVLTSALTIAECTHAGEGDISERAQFLMSKLLTSGDYVELIQTTPFVATLARDLRWKHKINLKGADGVHAASALAEKCHEFITTDGRFDRLYNHHEAFERLGLRIVSADETNCLPAKYRQMGFEN